MSPPRRRASGRSNPRRKAPPRRDFWDGVDAGEEPVTLIHASEDASAMIRSLGPPPLPGRETIAERYLALAFDKASRRAVALAAASGLMEIDEVED
jgi:hypothetical protein